VTQMTKMMNRNPKAHIGNLAPPQTGVMRTILVNEIADGLMRLGIRSIRQLYTEEKQHPFVSEHPDFYALFPRAIAHRARALELLAGLAHDGWDASIEVLDADIAELRKVLQTAAFEVPKDVARMLKRAA
jgi:hypothetical protein